MRADSCCWLCSREALTGELGHEGYLRGTSKSPREPVLWVEKLPLGARSSSGSPVGLLRRTAEREFEAIFCVGADLSWLAWPDASDPDELVAGEDKRDSLALFFGDPGIR